MVRIIHVNVQMTCKVRLYLVWYLLFILAWYKKWEKLALELEKYICWWDGIRWNHTRHYAYIYTYDVKLLGYTCVPGFHIGGQIFRSLKMGGFEWQRLRTRLVSARTYFFRRGLILYPRIEFVPGLHTKKGRGEGKKMWSKQWKYYYRISIVFK